MRVGLGLAGVVGVGVLTTTMSLATPLTAQAAPAASLGYQPGLYLDNGWLCRGFSDGSYHCTSHWHWSNGQLVSDNPAWVPNSAATTNSNTQSSSGSCQDADNDATPDADDCAKNSGTGGRASGGGATGNYSNCGNGGICPNGGNPIGQLCKSTDYFGYISQWSVPPSCFGNIYSINPRNYVARSDFGWCNYWPEVMNPSRPSLLWGGYPRHSTPRPGATVYFAPGDQGASSSGHWAYVVAVAPGGQWMLVSEMNFYWRGGGWQKVDYRYVHKDGGLSFIY